VVVDAWADPEESVATLIAAASRPMPATRLHRRARTGHLIMAAWLPPDDPAVATSDVIV